MGYKTRRHPSTVHPNLCQGVLHPFGSSRSGGLPLGFSSLFSSRKERNRDFHDREWVHLNRKCLPETWRDYRKTWGPNSPRVIIYEILWYNFEESVGYFRDPFMRKWSSLFVPFIRVLKYLDSSLGPGWCVGANKSHLTNWRNSE